MKSEEVGYTFPESELERFRIHGLANARTGKMEPFPEILTSCQIDLSKLVLIADPIAFWLKRRERAPQVIFASDRVLNISIPDSAVYVPDDRRLLSFELGLSYKHPNLPYDRNVEVEVGFDNGSKCVVPFYL